MTWLAYTISHDPSGDEAEAETRAAAVVAARTLLEDNGFEGQCRVFHGSDVVDVVWADTAESFTHIQMKEGK